MYDTPKIYRLHIENFNRMSEITYRSARYTLTDHIGITYLMRQIQRGKASIVLNGSDLRCSEKTWNYKKSPIHILRYLSLHIVIRSNRPAVEVIPRQSTGFWWVLLCLLKMSISIGLMYMTIDMCAYSKVFLHSRRHYCNWSMHQSGRNWYKMLIHRPRRI